MNIKMKKVIFPHGKLSVNLRRITTTSSISNNLPKVREICLEGNDGIIILDEFNKPC